MKKISYYKLFMYLLLLNSFVSITNELYPASLNLGKIVGAIQIIVLLGIYIKTLKRNDVFFLMFIITFGMLTIFRINDASVDLEHTIFFISTAMILWKFSELSVRQEMKAEFKKNSRKIFRITNLLLGVIIISIFFSKCWCIINGQRVFTGFCDSGHKMAGNLCFLSSIYFLYFLDKDIKIRDLSFFAIIFGIVLLTGSRTYLISYFLIMVLLYIIKLRKYSIIKLMTPFIILLGIYFFINSSIFARFIIMGQNKYVSDDFWEATSSGRLIWWKIDIEDFSKFDLIHKILGKGFTYLYDLNLREYGLRISAHNDFLTLLISSGLYGLIGYLLILRRWFFKKDSNNKVQIVSVVFTILIFIINAMISGVYGAQQYMFCNLIISLILLDSNFKKEKEKKGRDELYNIRQRI